jgi:hypothetical protein
MGCGEGCGSAYGKSKRGKNIKIAHKNGFSALNVF